MINIYTDGACSGNPGIGGWGVVILENNKEILLKAIEQLNIKEKSIFINLSYNQVFKQPFIFEKINLDKTNAWPFVEAKKILREKKISIEKDLDDLDEVFQKIKYGHVQFMILIGKKKTLIPISLNYYVYGMGFIMHRIVQ